MLMEPLMVLEPSLLGFLQFMIAPSLLALIIVAPRRYAGPAGRFHWILAGATVGIGAFGYAFAVAWPYLLVWWLMR
jgi:hypothetical protein